MYNSGNSSKNVTGSSIVDGTVETVDIADDAVTNAKMATKPVEATSVVNTAGQDWAGVAYTDPDAVGANPTAKIYPDGTVVGSTDNGSYTKYPNGDLVCETPMVTLGVTSTAVGSMFRGGFTNQTFPVAFVLIHSGVCGERYNGTLYGWAKIYNLTTTLIGLRAFGTESTNTPSANATVKGTWK
jgi:hypothetical protein